jgi:hypothetical protein
MYMCNHLRTGVVAVLLNFCAFGFAQVDCHLAEKFQIWAAN